MVSVVVFLFYGFRRGRKRFFSFMVSVAERFFMVSVAASNVFYRGM